MSKGHQIEVSRGEEPFKGAASDLPHMLIVDQHGHYWRAYDDHYSMPAVSDENTGIEIVASYVLQSPVPDTGACGVEINLTETAYGNLYEPCRKAKGHAGNHDPSTPERSERMSERTHPHRPHRDENEPSHRLDALCWCQPTIEVVVAAPVGRIDLDRVLDFIDPQGNPIPTRDQAMLAVQRLRAALESPREERHG